MAPTDRSEGISSLSTRASSTVRFGRFASTLRSMSELANPETRATMMVFGPSVRMRSRNDSSNPRMIELIPTMAVMPMTTPRTVSAERILFARIVPKAMPIVSAKRATLTIGPYSRLNASIGSSLAAWMDGYSPKNNPTTAVIPMPMATE